MLKEFARLYPDGATKPGKQRGAGYKLTKFVRTDGFKKSSKERSTRKKWDQELFVRQMESLRGWSRPKALSMWESLRQNPKMKQYSGGPKESPLRLAIPAFLTGEEESVSEHEQFEIKGVQTESKAL